MNATGLRDQLIKLYERNEKGTNGFSKSVFVQTDTQWGRIDETSATSRNAQDRLQMKVDAVCEFDDTVTVPTGGILVDPDGTAWWVRGINPIRQLRRIRVLCDRVSGEQFTALTLQDSATTLDGTHLVDTP